MLHSLKRFWLVWVLLLSGTQSMFGFALLGPIGADTWQVDTIGYFLSPPMTNYTDIGAPKNIGEGYRWNMPTIYYTYDASFIDYFGSNGMAAVDAAFAVFNNLSNVDSYSSGLTEWPQTSTRINNTAYALGLIDLKSSTMAILMEQLGLAQPQRWIYCLHDRILISPAVCPDYEYLTVMRNYDPVTQVYSDTVNGTLYGFKIGENCGLNPNPSAPYVADAMEYSPDPAAYAAGQTFAVADYEGLFSYGDFYTSLTQDDLGGLRYLYSSNRINVEVTEPNSVQLYTNSSTNVIITTSNLALFVQQALTNNTTALLALYPGLLITSVSNFVTNLVTTNVSPFFYYPSGQPAGTELVGYNVTYTTNPILAYAYTFGNVITNHYYTSGYVSTITTNVTYPNGYPAGYVVTNAVTNTTIGSYINGDFYIIPTNLCGNGYQITATDLVSTISVTNILGTNATGATGITNGQNTVVTQITYYSQYTLVAYPVQCNTNSAVELREGVEHINFVRADYDSLLSGIWTPFTNYYSLTQVTNNLPLVQTYQRVVTQPDILISAADLASGPSATPASSAFTRNINFNSTAAPTNLSGPGTITPNVSFVFNKVGPLYFSPNPSFLTDRTAAQTFLWASYDGTTNYPVVYPSTVSLSNLLTEIFFQITNTSPLAVASITTNNAGFPYNVQLGATGGTPPYFWSVPTNSPALPPGLNLSAAGNISGEPTTTGTYDFIIQVTDSGSRTNEREFSIQVDP